LFIWESLFIWTKPRKTMQGYSRNREDFLELLYAKYFTMEEEINGCYGLWSRDTDYRLTEWLLDALPTLYQQDEVIFQYNQGKQDWSKKSCTLFSAIGAISDLFNVEIPLSVIKIWDEDSYNHWRMKGEWWWVALAVEFIADKWNESVYAKEYGKVAYYSIELKDDNLLKKILEKRYTVCTWFDWNWKYTNDKDDWILNGTEFGTKSYGHAVSAIWSTKYPARIKDNYYWTAKYNIYEVEHKFSEIPCFFERWFVYTKVAEDNLERVKKLNEMRTKILNWMDTNSSLWHLSWSQHHKDKLHEMNDFYRKWLDTIDTELKKYL